MNKWILIIVIICLSGCSMFGREVAILPEELLSEVDWESDLDFKDIVVGEDPYE